MCRPSRTTCVRHAHAAADVWSSSRRSNASGSPARHLPWPFHPGHTRRDPARLGSDSLRSAYARGTGAARADRHQRCRRPRRSTVLHADKPAIGASIRTVRIEGRPHTCCVAKLRRTLKSENPIAYRPCPAGSGLQDFPTPAGIRNSSGKRTFRFRRECQKADLATLGKRTTIDR